MTAVVSGPDVKYSSRRRERRGAFGEILAALTRTLDSRGDTSLMRGAFEESLRRVLPVRSIQLRERASRWVRQRDGNDGADAGLLQHDLRNPDAIRIVGVAPGQIPLVLPIPAQNAAANGDA